MYFKYLKRWEFWVAYVFFYILFSLLFSGAKADQGVVKAMAIIVFVVLNIFIQLFLQTEGMEGSSDMRFRAWLRSRLGVHPESSESDKIPLDAEELRIKETESEDSSRPREGN